jgi:hypothetical protein
MGGNSSVGGGVHSACKVMGTGGALLLIMVGRMLMTSSNLDTHAYPPQMTMFVVEMPLQEGTDA